MYRIPAPMPLRIPWVSIRVGTVRQKPAATSAPEKMMLPHIATLRKPKISTDLPTGIPIVNVRVAQMDPMKAMSCDMIAVSREVISQNSSYLGGYMREFVE
jgi:hypothetical protein